MVASIYDHPVTDPLDPLCQGVTALGGFLAGTDLIVVEHVFFPHGPGGQIGHADIRARPDAHFPALGMDGGESRGGREEHIRQHQPDNAQQEHRQFQTARRFPAEGGIAVGNEWADAHHLRAEIVEEQQILRQMRGGLAGTLTNLGYEIYGNQAVLRGFGTMFQLSGYEDEPIKMRLEMDNGKTQKKLAPGKVQNIYQALITKHAKSVLTKRPLNAVDGLRNLELCDAAHKSARSNGKKISIVK